MQLAPDMDGLWLTSSSTLWQVLYSVLLGVHEREMRKKKRNKRFFPTMAFLFVLSLFCATLVFLLMHCLFGYGH